MANKVIIAGDFGGTKTHLALCECSPTERPKPLLERSYASQEHGSGTEILASLPAQLAGFGLKAVHLEVDRDKEPVRKLYEKMGFQARDRYMLMTRAL